MAKHKMIQALDILLKDLASKRNLLDGKVIVFGGDFRQTLHVVHNGKEKILYRGLLYSIYGINLKSYTYRENMRAKEDPTFCEYLMQIGNGQEITNSNNKIEIPHNFIIPYTNEIESLHQLFRATYPNISTFFSNLSSITSRVILTTKNDFVNEINDMLIQQLPNDAKIYTAIDETLEAADQCQFEDFLHNLNHANLVQIDFEKIVGYIVAKLKSILEGLCNGTINMS
ncbi:hypothetical protein H5410_059851 [Solanum commersonii]|uniref:ATP-dependent DNA helicase n=1 Tax=Solanum commersonii TaxID=4109 RepID=A0A9J5W3J8_SOLCO|nr:hypothetical protein H5410_059851 [Solanum commersonii]